MKSEKIQNAIGMVDCDLVQRAEAFSGNKKRNIRRVVPIAAALVILIVCGIVFGSGVKDLFMKNGLQPSVCNTEPVSVELVSVDLKPYCLASAVYPERVEYSLYDSEKWVSDSKERRAYAGAGDDLDEFFTDTVYEFLKDAGNENVVYSPLNVYMSLAMLAETAQGDSRQQILDLLGTDNIETLRTQAHDIWNFHFQDDGITTLKLSNSLWLRNDINYNRELLSTLSDYYYASSFKGEMGSEDYSNALRTWINDQTSGFLKDQISDVNLSADDMMALVSTIYFKDGWSSEFLQQNTYKEMFFAPNGESEVDFMHKTLINDTYYWGDNFSSIVLDYEGGGTMTFISPDDGVNAADLLSDAETLSFILGDNYNWENQKRLKVNISVPKFDVSSNLRLKEAFKRLGAEDCFSPEDSDFSVSSKDNENNDIFVSDIQHRARVKIDEEGTEAAAVTITKYGAGAPLDQEEEIDFVLDRPFLFVISSEDCLPLFVGIVNNP